MACVSGLHLKVGAIFFSCLRMHAVSLSELSAEPQKNLSCRAMPRCIKVWSIFALEYRIFVITPFGMFFSPKYFHAFLRRGSYHFVNNLNKDKQNRQRSCGCIAEIQHLDSFSLGSKRRDQNFELHFVHISLFNFHKGKLRQSVLLPEY